MLRRLCVLFARAPRLGTVKRRLARDIGDRAALRFHESTATALLRGLARDRRFRTILAVTPDRARWRAPVPRVGQGRGDLGARMYHACARMSRGQIVIVGSDIPGVGADDVAAAFRALGGADAVFGPALDGGYWLVGLGPRRPAQPFAGVRWSSEHALADTLANFRGRRVAFLRTMRDVDTADDLRAVGRPVMEP
ncbi:MAG: TIGR04282 family arsenosugar biosynthesis glycosyltransferase [Acetobacteraceae bacterium]|nr:TIGR04282 family arsenosugar biosynthesis glycosyltransferase [Acetobacteraceae bacterium]